MNIRRKCPWDIWTGPETFMGVATIISPAVSNVHTSILNSPVTIITVRTWFKKHWKRPRRWSGNAYRMSIQHSTTLLALNTAYFYLPIQRMEHEKWSFFLFEDKCIFIRGVVGLQTFRGEGHFFWSNIKSWQTNAYLKHVGTPSFFLECAFKPKIFSRVDRLW